MTEKSEYKNTNNTFNVIYSIFIWQGQFFTVSVLLADLILGKKCLPIPLVDYPFLVLLQIDHNRNTWALQIWIHHAINE